jgi:site-specific DNA-adenine methylase
MRKYERIVEPFCGGAAFTLGVGPQRAWLNDLDHDLYCLWRSVVTYPEDLCGLVQAAKIKPSDFYSLRAKLLRNDLRLDGATLSCGEPSTS